MRSFSQVTLGLALAAALVCGDSAALAQKKGGNATKTHRLVVLDLETGGATAMTEAATVGGMTSVGVVGWVGEFARFWHVSDTGGVESIPLALPPDVDPASPLASAQAMNGAGTIVGGCRRLGTLPGQPLLWEDPMADPLLLPLPDGFSGWAMPRAINNGGVIVGELSGDLTTAGEFEHVEGLVAWLAWRDENGQLQVGAPTWFPFATIGIPRLNDAGWVAFDCSAGELRLQLDHRWVWDEARQEYASEFYFSGGTGALFGSDTVATVGGINEAGDVAGVYRTVGQPGQDVYVQRLDGTLVSMPVYINDRTYGTYVFGVSAVNDATAQHAVQVLGLAGVYYKKSLSSVGPRGWAVWESGGSVRLLKDVTDLPTDSTYDFSSVTSFADLNDGSWICGRVARGESKVGVPVVLIRKP